MIKVTLEFETKEEMIAYFSNSTEVKESVKSEEVSAPKTKAKAKAKEVVELVEPKVAVVAPSITATNNPFGNSANNFGPKTVAAIPEEEIEEVIYNRTSMIAGVTEIYQMLSGRGMDAGAIGQEFGKVFAKIGVTPIKVSMLPDPQLAAFYAEAKNLVSSNAQALV